MSSRPDDPTDLTARPGRRRQRAIQLPLVTVGLVFFAGTILFNMSPVLPKISELWAVSEYVAPPVMLLYCYNLGALFLLLALTPTQRRVVRFGVVVFLILAAFSIVTYVPGHVVPYARTVVLCTRARDADGAPSAPCDPNDVLHLAETSFVTLVFLIAIVLVLVNTFHVKKFPPPRAQLDWLWRAYATTQIAMGAIALAEDFRATLGSGRPRIAPFSFSVLMIVTGGAAATGRLREVVHTWLASRGEGIQSATVISVLLNGRSAEAALRLAQDSFRAITVDKVDVDGLSGRLPEADCFAESHPATLGSVDAFVCHSHHDSPEEKVAQLRAWAAEFSRTHGRAPRVWIDTHCLDSRDVEPSLACLPVFMAGCDRVLVLHGPTLPERLWCVTELFIHLIIGTDRDTELEVMRLPSVVASTDGQTIEHFDARHAQCAFNEDRQLLLTVIEAYPGGIGAFNSKVVEMLQSRFGDTPQGRSAHNLGGIRVQPEDAA